MSSFASKVLVAGSGCVLISFAAQASFKCGPGFDTYSVASTHGVVGQGVRCVKFNNYEIVNGGIAGAYWYAEGVWGTTKYRNIGYSYKTLKDFSGDYTSMATAIDIYGNGENTAGVNYNLTLVPTSGYNKITVPGWGEEWTRQTSGVQSSYTSTLAAVKSCGAHLDTYAVSSANGAPANGVRCAIRDANIIAPAMWYGEGSWGSENYRNLGFVQMSSTEATINGTAADICNIASDTCGATSTNGLDIKPMMGCWQTVKYKVTGQWNENWTGTTSYECPK